MNSKIPHIWGRRETEDMKIVHVFQYLFQVLQYMSTVQQQLGKKFCYFVRLYNCKIILSNINRHILSILRLKPFD